MYIIVCIIALFIGYCIRGSTVKQDAKYEDKLRHKPKSGKKVIVALESGGGYATEYYRISSGDLWTLQQVERSKGFLEADRSTFDSTVKPILDRSEKITTIVTILGYG